MASDKYKQHDGYDKYRNVDKDTGRTKNSGKAEYNSDGTLKRLSNISPSSRSGDYHHHEWLQKKSDGSYQYGHGEHKNH